MEMLFGLFSLAGLALFLGRVFRRSASVMPLVAVSIAMLWFTLFGALGFLAVGGWLWYAACAAALAFCVATEKAALLKRLTPGFLFFVAGSVLFITLFFATKPMLTQWDEFTFWGAAGKVVTNTGQLYTTAQSNLIARYAPPGLLVFSYMLQFFGKSFAEHQFMAAFAMVYLAGFAAATALWDKTRAGATVIFAAFFALPFLFDGSGTGVVSYSYLSCMADTALAAFFGGALCLYFVLDKKDAKQLLLFGIALAALTNIKDVGLALACIAWLVALLDTMFCEYKTVAFFALRRWKAALAHAVVGLVFIMGSYAGWAAHILAATKINRANVGSGGGGMSQLTMMLTGIKALLRIQPDAVFDDRATKMVQGFFGNYQGQSSANFRLWVFGPAVRMLLVILAVLFLAWLFSSRPQKRRVLVFTLAMLAGFVMFSIFLTFTYTYIFKGGEAETLKDYARYSMPYWFGWFMAALVLLGTAATQKAKQLHWRPVFAKAGVLLVAVCVLGSVLARGNWQANFLRVSPALFGKRLDVQSVVKIAEQEGMQPGDIVYLISQEDDASRFYMFSYELEKTTLATLYRAPTPGDEWQTNGKLPLGTTAASLVPPGSVGGYAEAAECTPNDLLAYLQARGCTHILLDRADGYIKEFFGPLFSDGLAGWNEDGQYQSGPRYYQIVWQGKTASFVPAQKGAKA
ncbi:hypothetical protein LJC61_07775 [Ruminococcaceae bacterium OttesenSCG-928-A16]|nr:hypothetical protein [Ruminococcaceae bacterium OttesenSCG-928-A16]